MTTLAPPSIASSTWIFGRQHARDDILDVECCYVPKSLMQIRRQVGQGPNPNPSPNPNPNQAHTHSSKPSNANSSSINSKPQHNSASPPCPPDLKRSHSKQYPKKKKHVVVLAGNNTVKQASVQTVEELTKMRRLWRTFRRRMRQEQRDAVEQELESDMALQYLEQERELQQTMVDEPLLLVDSQKEHTRYELVLPKSLSKDQEEKHIDGGFWEFLHLFNKKKKVRDDADTISTSDNTSLADDYSLQSQASWFSFQSQETTQADNCRSDRDLLLTHYEGGDDPWSAAQRGDLEALVQRWKYRHDWTLEDQDGNTPLYYACQSGGNKNLRVVLLLLQQWPSTQHIPESLLESCKIDAANGYVLELLDNPSQAEWIIANWEEHASRRNNDDIVDFVEDRYSSRYDSD